ncbi:MAG: hypothetical protein HYT90_06005 [Candidatus Omnitrophica bacterium]|nr:hypothetical protein [Candidatus Omnitrophota bacterium]
MGIVLAVFGWYLVVVGALLCAKPPMGKRLADWWLKDKLSRRWALLPLAVGLLVLWAAPASRVPTFIRTLGWLGVLKGIVLLIAPREPLMQFVSWWHRLPSGGLRLWGVVAAAFGAAILGSL